MSSSGYVDAPLETDPDTIALDSFTFIEQQFPGWTPNEPNLDVIIIEGMAQEAAVNRDLAASALVAIFRFMGVLVADLPIDATPATGTVTFTVRDTLGYTIPAATLVGIPAGGSIVAFQTLFDAVVPVGATTIAGVQIAAVVPGTQGSGLGSTALAIQMIDTIGYVTGVVLAAATTGGADAESDEIYLNRLSNDLQLLTPRPILPNDFVVLARKIPGVWRALAIDGYNTADSTSGNERMVTVVSVDQSGAAVSAGIRSQVQTYLDGLRELTFVVNVMDPTSTGVDVTFAATKFPGYVASDVQARAIQAIQAYLSPATWGSLDSGDQRAWINTTIVRMGKLYQAIENTQGVQYVTSLQVALHGNALGVIDVTLPGVAPLPFPYTITGTVT